MQLAHIILLPLFVACTSCKNDQIIHEELFWKHPASTMAVTLPNNLKKSECKKGDPTKNRGAPPICFIVEILSSREDAPITHNCFIIQERQNKTKSCLYLLGQHP